MSIILVNNIAPYSATSVNINGALSATTISATTYYGNGSNLTGVGGQVEVTYSELVNKITGDTLTKGVYYLISDFKTCYDVPEYYINGNAKGSSEINYRQGNIEPIIVLATSTSTISSTAYQPSYPNDRIQYDWTWNTTEITGGIAYGRITERIDEYSNRTDYDHRNITFNRFQSYTRGQKLTGDIIALAWSQSILMGNGTSFLSEVNPGDILLIDGYQLGGIGVKVVSATTDTTLIIVTDPTFGGIPFCGNTYSFYSSTSTGNYDEYKEVYIGQKNQEDWDDVLTFNLNGTALHNYIGDYSKFYLEGNLSNSGFLLANNVFFSNNSEIYSNTIGDRSFNNTGRYWFLRNTIAGRFYNNTTHQNGFYSNSIGEYFNNNIINSQIWSNTIGEGFNENLIYNQFYDNHIDNAFYGNKVYSQFYNNKIGNYFDNNKVYSEFYDNIIFNIFTGNTIGDNGNLANFEFYRNRIGNNFEYNTVRQYFQNNQIGNQFNNNILNGTFYKNVIGNDFNYNQNIGYNFYGNHIGNGFNNNDLIGDYFNSNQIGEYFNNNDISYQFDNNQIGNQFNNNTLGDTQYFNWDNTSIENLTARTYNTFYNSLYGNIGDVILGKELIMNFYSNSGSTKTGGSLIIGDTYEITDILFPGGDFSNVADVISGTINTIGCVFTATGPNPTSWCGVTVTELTVYNEYHKVKFNQWTQNANGGGFSYERTKVYPTSEPTVYFTRINYSNDIDIIIEGRLELRRNNNGGIYNAAVEGNFSSNSPLGTQWNSIYTQPFNGSSFEDNTIGNEFKGNYIRGEFQLNSISSIVGSNQFSGNTYSNNIGDYTFSNDFLGEVAGNILFGDFYDNTIGDDLDKNTFESGFYGNTVIGFMEGNKIGLNTYGNIFSGGTLTGNDWKGDFYDNTIDGSFDGNTIGFTFNNNTIVGNIQGNKFGYQTYQNIIIDDFTGNTVGNYFNNNEFSGGTIENIIGDLCYENQILNSFEGNNISYGFKGNLILEQFGFNNVNFGFTANQISGTTLFNTFGDITIGNDFLGNFISNKIGNLFVENFVGNDFSLNTIGESFGFNIIGNSFGANILGIGFQHNTIGNDFQNNQIGSLSQYNVIGNNFGYGATAPQGNVIGNNFNNNVIGEYFYNNSIPDNFSDNTIDNYFQWNIVNTEVNGFCLSTGMLYDTTTVNVFKNKNNANRLSYYDEFDILTIETLTEAPCLGGLNALDIPENDLNFGLVMV